jgi:MFS family permease
MACFSGTSDMSKVTMTEPVPAPPRRALVFSNVAHFFTHVVMLLFPTVVLVLEPVFDLAYGELISLMMPGYVLFGLAALPAGWLGDRWSTRGMLIIFFLGTGVATFMTGFAQTPLELGLGLAFIGLFAAIYHPVGTSFIVRHAINRGKALGQNGIFGTAGVAVAALVAATLTDGFGWRVAFFVPGILCTASGVIFWLYTEPEHRISKAQDDEKSGFAFDRRIALRGLLVLGVTITGAGLIAQAFLIGLPKVFAVGVSLGGGDGLAGTGTLVTLALLIGASGQLIGGYLADRFPLKLVYISMYVLLLPVAIVTANIGGVPLIFTAILIQLFLTTTLPTENCLVANFCPTDWHARAYGAKFVLALGVSAIAVPAVGIIFDKTGGYFWLFMAIAIIVAVIIVFALFLPGGNKAVEPAQAAPAPGAAE